MAEHGWEPGSEQDMQWRENIRQGHKRNIVPCKCGNTSWNGVCARCRAKVAARLQSHIADAVEEFRPRPLIYVIPDDYIPRYGREVEPDTGRVIHVMSTRMYRKIDAIIMFKRGYPLAELAEVRYVPADENTKVWRHNLQHRINWAERDIDVTPPLTEHIDITIETFDTSAPFVTAE